MAGAALLFPKHSLACASAKPRYSLVAARQIEFHVVVLQEPKILYRACFGRGRDALLRAMSSNYEVNRHPPHPADLRATVLHMAVSGFENRDLLAQLARKRPDRIGSHIARLELRPNHGVCIADTGGVGHWSVWGIPAQLTEFIADVEDI
jgi:hypothetical protein